MDVVAKHGARVAVCAADGGAGEGDEGGVRQRVAQVLGVADLVAFGGLHGVRWRGKFGTIGRHCTITSRYNIDSYLCIPCLGLRHFSC